MAVPALLAAAPGLIKAGASLFGAGKRKRAEQAAQKRFDAQSAALENFQFTNNAANQENVYEDATINQQADQFQAQQGDATLAQGLDAFTASGGGGGGAQAFANAALQSSQGRGANIAAQEQGIQANTLGEQSRLNAAEVAGADQLQQQQHGQVQQQFNLGQQNLAQAQQARQQAKADFVGGLSSAVGGAASAFGGGAGAAAGGGGGAADFSQFTSAPPPAPLSRQKDNPLKRLYGETPFKNNGRTGPDKIVRDAKTNKVIPQGPEAQEAAPELPDNPTWNPDTKRYEGKSIKRDRTGHLSTGRQKYAKTRALYGDSGYSAGGEDSKRLGDTAGYIADRDAFIASGGTREAFGDNYGERDSELGKKYLDRTLATRQRVQDDEAAFRAGQDEAFAGLDDESRRGQVAQLEQKLRKDPKLWRQLTGDSAAGAAGKGVFKQIFGRSSSGGARDLDSDQFHNVLAGLEKAGVNPREYLGFLQKKEAPTKRSPLYRMFKMKFNGMYK